MNLGDLAIRRRSELGISRKQLADAVDVAPGTARSLERNKWCPLDTTRSAIEFQLNWEYGSLEKARNGEDPVAIHVSAIRHPMRRESLASKELLKRKGWSSTSGPTPVVEKLQPDDVPDLIRKAANADLRSLRASIRMIDAVPEPIQELILGQAWDELDTITSMLATANNRALTLRAYELLDKQKDGPKPAAAVRPAEYGPRPGAPESVPEPVDEDLLSLPYAAHRDGDDPEADQDDSRYEP